MSNYDPKMRGPDYRAPGNRNRMNSGSWIAGAIIVVILLVAIGYVFSNRMTNDAGVDHRAAATDPANPSPAARPSDAPSPGQNNGAPNNASKP